jgi:hypothetical protein
MTTAPFEVPDVEDVQLELGTQRLGRRHASGPFGGRPRAPESITALTRTRR